MRLAFVVRVAFDGARWTLTLLDVASGEYRQFHSFEGCLAAVRERSEAHVLRGRRPHPSPGRER